MGEIQRAHDPRNWNDAHAARVLDGYHKPKAFKERPTGIA
jgi:hypothetical protein